MMTGEESNKKLYLEFSEEKKSTKNTCFSPSNLNVIQHFVISLPKLENTLGRIFSSLVFFSIYQSLYESQNCFIQVKIHFGPIGVFITCKCHLLLGWNHIGKWKIHDQ